MLIRHTTPFQKTEYVGKVPYLFFLLWLVLFNFLLFCGFVVHDMGYTEKVMQADQSYITLLITVLFLCASLYCAICLFKSSHNLIRAEQFIASLQTKNQQILAARSLAPQSNKLIDGFINELAELYKDKEKESTSNGINQANYTLEIYVDEIRSPGEIIQFIIDVLIRLGLIGTIIGFILMLQSFVSGPNPSAENIQELLITMSSGMGTALYTTFAGLIASMLLGIQQILLHKNVEQIIAALIRLSDRSSISKLSHLLERKVG